MLQLGPKLPGCTMNDTFIKTSSKSFLQLGTAIPTLIRSSVLLIMLGFMEFNPPLFELSPPPPLLEKKPNIFFLF